MSTSELRSGSREARPPSGRSPSGNGLSDASIADDPQFRALVRERSSFAWLLTAVMVAVYLGFIFLVAFGHDLMAAKVAGSEVSLGILLGLGVIVLAFILTGVYVARANTRFDDLTRAIVEGRRS